MNELIQLSDSRMHYDCYPFRLESWSIYLTKDNGMQYEVWDTIWMIEIAI